MDMHRTLETEREKLMLLIMVLQSHSLNQLSNVLKHRSNVGLDRDSDVVKLMQHLTSFVLTGEQTN